MNKSEIYYFSGTGNSLHVARELQKRIPEATLIPMVSLLNKESIKTNAETVGFVFPIYMTEIPTPVKNFIEKLDIEAPKYIYAIATRIGMTHVAFKRIDKILRGKGRWLDSYFSINMPGNDPKFNYKVPSEEEISELETVAQSRLDIIREIVVNKEQCREKDITYTFKVPFLGLVSKLAIFSDSMYNNMYADGKCTGCGTCKKVCPAGKIDMINGKPVWQKKSRCYKCSACLNFCPEQAVQLKSYTEKNGRYSHPYATVDDIAGQKESVL